MNIRMGDQGRNALRPYIAYHGMDQSETKLQINRYYELLER